LLLFAGAAVGGAALGFLAERRGVDSGVEEVDPEWSALRRSPPGERITVQSADGTTLAARVAGPEGAPVIVFAHSYAMSSAVWLYQMRDLSDEFRVVAYDLRGHGDSGPASGRAYTTATLAQDLAAVIDATATGPVLVAGHSMGGISIMAYGQEYPGEVRDRLAGAALLNTASSRLVWRGLLSAGAVTIGGLQQALRRRARDGGVLRLPGARANDLTYLLTRMLALSAEASPAHVAFVEEQIVGSPSDVLAAFARTLGSLDLDDALEHLDVPVIVIAGDSDRLTPRRQARDLAAALPDARLVELAGVGHFSTLEAADAVTGHLRDHARRVLGRPPAHRRSRRGGR
jgi:pimeloyl-ACP methyl ester carboxylesterase